MDQPPKGPQPVQHHPQRFSRKHPEDRQDQRPRRLQRLSLSFLSILIMVIPLILGGPGCRQGEQGAKQPGEAFSVAVPLRVGYTAMFVGVEKDYFHHEGLNVAVKPVPTGQEGLKALLAGEVQATSASDVLIAESILKGDRIAVIATLSEAQQASVIVAKKESGITAPADLKGKAIGVAQGTGAAFFLHIYLVANNIAPSEVRIVDIEPDRIDAALLEGEVEAVSTWTSQKIILLERLGDDAVVLSDSGLYVQTFNLVTLNDQLKKKPENLEKLLRGIVRANDFIKTNPGDAQNILSEYTGVEK